MIYESMDLSIDGLNDRSIDVINLLTIKITKWGTNESMDQLDPWIAGLMDGLINAWIDGWIDGSIGLMDG